MTPRVSLSAVVITLNEEANIERCLKSLDWVDEVLVVDSGSTDRTCEIARGLGARVETHEWRGYGQQKNWAMAQSKHDWVLFLDADEEVSVDLRREIDFFMKERGRLGGTQYAGASVPRKTWYLGRWILHGGWYPNRLVRLVKKDGAAWSEPPVHESLTCKGAIYALRADLFHYTFRDVGEQVLTNIRFSRLGAKLAKDRGESGNLWRVIAKPFTKFVETYVWKLGLLDGLPGFVISINAAHSQFMKYVELYFEKNSRR